MSDPRAPSHAREVNRADIPPRCTSAMANQRPVPTPER